MPELPEVETIVARLRELITGKKIEKITALRDKSFQGDLSLATESTISDVSRRAKMIRIHLENDQNLLVHLKMTGQLIYVDETVRVGGGHPSQDWIQTLPSSHTRVVIDFADGSNLFFNDQRVFGWVKMMDQNQLSEEFAKYGPDVIDEEFSQDYFVSQFARKTLPIKQLIMDNKIVAGVGNIYACDALNLAGIDPFRRSNTLSKREILKLHQAMIKVINLGIKHKGATVSDYRDVDGFSGSYQDVSMVYGREGEACKVCGRTITKEKLGGRGTYYCPECQI